MSRRIALVGPFAPLRGGIAQFNDALADALVRRGNDVLPVSYSRLYPSLLFPGSSQFADGATARPGLEITLDSLNPLSWGATARRIRAWRADATVLAWWTPPLGPAVGRVARRSGCPTIGLLHNALPHDRLPLSRHLAAYALRGMSGGLALSERVADTARSLGLSGPVATAIHPPYDRFGPAPSREEARRMLGLDERRTVLLFFGLIRPYKGLDVLLDAMPTILRSRPDVTLVVAGEVYGDRSELDRRIAGMNHVRLIDRFIPDAEVPTYYAAADAVVQPYRRATQSGVMAVAAHYGCPVVVTDVGDLGRVVRRFDAGTVAAPGDAEALAGAVLSGLDPAALRRNGAGMRNLAAASSWDALCAALDGVISDVSS